MSKDFIGWNLICNPLYVVFSLILGRRQKLDPTYTVRLFLDNPLRKYVFMVLYLGKQSLKTDAKHSIHFILELDY